jgi:hypothetical protein
MAKKITFKPDGDEYRMPGDNVIKKKWIIRVNGEEAGLIRCEIRDLFMSLTSPGYSVTMTTEVLGVERTYREYSAAFSNRSMREAKENRSTYFQRSKEWAIEKLSEPTQENTAAV